MSICRVSPFLSHPVPCVQRFLSMVSITNLIVLRFNLEGPAQRWEGKRTRGRGNGEMLTALPRTYAALKAFPSHALHRVAMPTPVIKRQTLLSDGNNKAHPDKTEKEEEDWGGGILRGRLWLTLAAEQVPLGQSIAEGNASKKKKRGTCQEHSVAAFLCLFFPTPTTEPAVHATCNQEFFIFFKTYMHIFCQ